MAGREGGRDLTELECVVVGGRSPVFFFFFFGAGLI